MNPTPNAFAFNGGPYCVNQTIGLNANMSRGVNPTQYQWIGAGGFSSNLQSPTFIATTTAYTGLYSVTLTDVNSCTASATTSVVVHPNPVISAGSNSPVCEGSTLNLNANQTVGTAPLMWAWNGPNGFNSTSQTPIRANMALSMAGTYSITVNDVFSCSASTTVSIVVNPTPTAIAITNAPICAGNNLTLSVTPAGGTPNYQFTWTGPAFSSNSQSPTRLSSTPAMTGMYIVTVSDANGCTTSANVPVIINALPTPTALGNLICAGETLMLSAAGGTGYTWAGPNGFGSFSQNPTIASATTAATGTYTVTAINAAGCTATATATASVKPLPTPTASTSPNVCVNATINLVSSGGGTYQWAGPAGFTSMLQSPAISLANTSMTGTYTVIVTVNGCTNTATTSLSVLALPVASASGVTVCVGDAIVISASGGTSYSWSGINGFMSNAQNPIVSSSATLAMQGNYTVTVQGTNTCTISAQAAVQVKALPVIASSSNSAVCEGGTLQLSATGATSYSWTGPNGFGSNQQAPTISQVGASIQGTYTVTGFGSNGCSVSQTISVGVRFLGLLTATTTSPICEGTTLALSANGGLSYAWSGPNNFVSNAQYPTIDNATMASAGSYSVTITAPSQCTVQLILLVQMRPRPTLLLTNNSPLCTGGTLQLSTTGAGVGGTYAWTGPNGYTSNLQAPTRATAIPSMQGVYSLSASTQYSCTNSATTSVLILEQAAAAVATTPVCEGGLLSLKANTNGTGYFWSGPSGFTSNLQAPDRMPALPSMSGTYTVTVYSAGNCTATTTVSTVVNPAPPATIAANGTFAQPLCEGNSLNLSATGGTQYSWSGPNGFTSNLQSPRISNVTTAAAGTYSITVTGLNGCGTSLTTAVFVNRTPEYLVVVQAPTCVNNNPQANGKIMLSVYNPADRYDYSTGITYSGSRVYANASSVPADGVVSSTLVNPATIAGQTYTIRMFSPLGCVMDKTILLPRTECECQPAKCVPFSVGGQ